MGKLIQKHQAIKTTKLKKNLHVTGSYETAVMSGHSCGVIHIFEEQLGRPLTWSICLLHCKELPWRRALRLLDEVYWS